MEKVKSLFVSLVIYFSVGLILAELLFLATDMLLNNAVLKLINPNPSYVQYNDGIINTYFYESELNGTSNISVSEWFDVLWKTRQITPFVIFGLSVFVTAFLFYRQKLRKDLIILQHGIKKIQNQDLDFEVWSNSKNELGQLCNSFETLCENGRRTGCSIGKRVLPYI